MNFQKSMRNIAFVSALLLAIVTLLAEGTFSRPVFGILSMVLTIIGVAYCLPIPRVKDASLPGRS